MQNKYTVFFFLFEIDNHMEDLYNNKDGLLR